MKSKLFSAALMAAVLAVPASAQDDAATKKKGARRGQASVGMQVIKQLEEAKLTDEQVAKIKELAKATDAKMKTIRQEAGITPALTKKRLECRRR